MGVFLFAYGSLLNADTNYQLNNYKKKKMYPVIVSGLRRQYNVAGDSETLLGVYKDNSAVCNGALIKINNNELDRLTNREKKYTVGRISIKQLIFKYGIKGNKSQQPIKISEDDTIIYFKPITQYVSQYIHTGSVPDTPYLKRCITGASRFGDVFLQDFIDTTYNIDVNK